MANQLDPVAEQQAPRLDAMIAEFHAARQRRLVQQGMALWNRTEEAFQNAAAHGQPPPSELN